MVNDNPQRSAHVSINPSLNFANIRQVILGKNLELDLYASRIGASERAFLLCGRPRAILRFAEILDEPALKGAKIHPRAILCSGDNLYETNRRLIESTFNAPVYNAYASQEGGFIAMECTNRDGLHVIEERAIVEVLPEGELTPSSEGRGELIITNLENWGMPLIRYKSGDQASITYKPCSCGVIGPRIIGLDGRDSTYFIFNHHHINPSVLNPLFESLPISQFQVVQDDSSSVSIFWVSKTENVDISSINQSIITAFLELGASNVQCKKVESIGLQGQKVQRYKRNYN
jgi:phenylacetate-CoA ligase